MTSSRSRVEIPRVSSPDELKQLIVTLGCRPIAFIPAYARIPGLDVNCALMLSQMIYWSPRTKGQDGWIYKTRDKWSEETGLGLRQIDLARKKLRSCGILHERLQDVPARRYYRVDFATLASLLVNLDFPEQANKTDRDSSSREQNLKTSVPEKGNLSLYTETTAETSQRPQKREPEPARIHLPNNFDAGEEYYDFAARLGYEKCQVDDAVLKFIEYHEARGTKMADWNAAFKSWLRRGKENGWDGVY